jgi:cytidylate kinase
MQIVCISRGSLGAGEQLAQKLAEKLGFDCVSRESITDRATDSGIQVGKLEMAVARRRPLTEALAIEFDRFRAFMTAALCEHALDKSIVYHGRTGHLVLPGVSHVLRVRAIADMDIRIRMSIERMRLDHKKAREFNEHIDEDIRRWVRTQYNVDWESPSLYDATINLSKLNVDNSATAVMHMAQLPEFQATPASIQSLRDLLLSARCRSAIGADARTRDMNVRVQAQSGVVSVTYNPWQAQTAKHLPEVLHGVPGVDSCACTSATTNIVFVQERFDPEEDSLRNLLDVAERWGAAVEMVWLREGEKGTADGETDSGQQARSQSPTSDEPTGGILDDVAAESLAKEPEGIELTKDRLIRAGRFGGFFRVDGGPEAIVTRLGSTASRSLVVVGNVFGSRESAVQKRMTRGLVGMMAEKMRIPVVGADELRTSYFMGSRQWLTLLGTVIITAILYVMVFTFQEPLLAFVGAPAQKGASLLSKLIVAAVVACVVPIWAAIVGSFWHNVLRLLRIE